jgi:beta-mannosidase
VTIKPRRVTETAKVNDALAVYVVNDHDEPWCGRCVLKQVDVRGEPLAEHVAKVDVAPRSVGRFLVPEAMHGRRDSALVATLEGGERGWWWFAPDRELDYHTPSFAYDGYRDGDAYVFAVTAGTLLRDLCIFADRLDAKAEVDDACVTLLPGETHKFHITGVKDLDADALAQAPMLRTANAFGRNG